MRRYHSPKEYLEEARSPDTSPHRLDLLAESEWEFVRAAVAENPNTDVRTLFHLARITEQLWDEPVAIAVARRAEAPSEALQILAERFARAVDGRAQTMGFDPELGLALLNNPATPDDAIAKLLDPAHSTTHFRARAASTTKRPDVLALLCRDVSEKVQKRAKRALMMSSSENSTPKD
jgi:hypothetical protein